MDPYHSRIDLKATAICSAALSGILAGLSVVATRAIVLPPYSYDPLSVAVVRNIVGCLFLAVVALPTTCRQMTRNRLHALLSDIPALVLIGGPGFCLFPLLFTIALQSTGAAEASLVLAAIPAVTLLVASAIGRERPTTGRLLSCLIAASGVCLALGLDLHKIGRPGIAGAVAMAGAAAAAATYNVLIAPFTARHGGLLVVLVSMIIGTMVLSLVVAAAERPLWVSADNHTWCILLYIGAAAGISNWLLGVALRYLTPTRVAIFFSLNPAAAAIGGTLMLNEPITLAQLAGFALVCAGIMIMNSKWANPAAGSLSRPPND